MTTLAVVFIVDLLVTWISIGWFVFEFFGKKSRKQNIITMIKIITQLFFFLLFVPFLLPSRTQNLLPQDVFLQLDTILRVISIQRFIMAGLIFCWALMDDGSNRRSMINTMLITYHLILCGYYAFQFALF